MVIAVKRFCVLYLEKVLIEKPVPIKRELYLSVALDRKAGNAQLKESLVNAWCARTP